MRMSTVRAVLLACAAVSAPVLALAADPAGPAPADPTRQVRLRVVDLSARLPGDLLAPEGKSRWDLKTVPLGRTFVRTLSETAEGIALRDEADDPAVPEAAHATAAGTTGEVVHEEVVYKDDRDRGDGRPRGEA